MKIFSFYEYKTGEKIKTRWSKNDNIIALYYEKFGLHRVGVTEDSLEGFVASTIGSTKNSLNMQALNFRYLLALNRGEELKGLPHYSKLQEEVAEEYDSYSEDKLREVVLNIIDNISDETRKENIIKAENMKKEEKKKKIVPVPFEPVNIYGNKMTKFSDYVPKESDFSVEVGDILTHTKFGTGEVLGIEDGKLIIQFDNLPEPKRLVYSDKYFV